MLRNQGPISTSFSSLKEWKEKREEMKGKGTGERGKGGDKRKAGMKRGGNKLPVPSLQEKALLMLTTN